MGEDEGERLRPSSKGSDSLSRASKARTLAGAESQKQEASCPVSMRAACINGNQNGQVGLEGCFTLPSKCCVMGD